MMSAGGVDARDEWGRAGGADGLDWLHRLESGAVCGPGEQLMDLAELFLEGSQFLGIRSGGGVRDEQREQRFFVFELGFDGLTCAGDGVALVVEEGLDAERGFDVATAIETLSGAAFVWTEMRKLTLPEAEDVGWDLAEAGDLTDTEVQLIRDVGSGVGVSFADWLILRHTRGCSEDAGEDAPCTFRCLSIGQCWGVDRNFAVESKGLRRWSRVWRRCMIRRSGLIGSRGEPRGRSWRISC